MIKFFRKIRYKLMSENKTSRYFKYAIGEIILVVIGILIALSINNWQTNNFNRKQENFYLRKLIQNITQDTTYLGQRLRQLDSSASVLGKARSELYNSEIQNFQHDSIGLFLVSVYRFTPQKSTMDNLLATGKLDLIQDQALVDSLFVYYNDLNNFPEQINASNELYSRGTFGPKLMEFPGGIFGLNKSELSLDEKEFIHNTIQMKQHINSGLVSDYILAKTRANNLLTIIEKNIDD